MAKNPIIIIGGGIGGLVLALELYAADPTVRFAALQETHKALRDVLGYRLYLDLRRGWRIMSPNLEQRGCCGSTTSHRPICARTKANSAVAMPLSHRRLRR